MDKNTLISRYARSEDERIKLARLFDMASKRDRRSIAVSGAFFSDQERLIGEKVLKEFGISEFFFWGGFEDAERRCPVFLPDYFEEGDVKASPSIASLAFLTAAVDGYYSDADISHRDVLGSLMGLGIERETVGDILVDGGIASAVVRESVAPFIIENLSKIGRYPVKCRLSDKMTLEKREDFEEAFDTVASLRLDAVVAAVFSTSRAAALDAISKGAVAVNGMTAVKSTAVVKAGDRISYRGKGKAEFSGEMGETKKGRIKISFKKYK